MQPHMVSPSMMHAQPQMYGQAYGGYYQQYRFAGPVSPPIFSSSLLIVLRLTLPLPPCLPFSSLVCRKACPQTATTLDHLTVHPTTPTHSTRAADRTVCRKGTPSSLEAGSSPCSLASLVSLEVTVDRLEVLRVRTPWVRS